MAGSSLGLIEVQGYSTALAVGDAMCKNASVEIIAMDCNNPAKGAAADIPLTVQIRITGEVSQVKEALAVGVRAAKKYNSEEDILTHCIPKTFKEIEQLIIIGKVKRK